MAILLNNIPVAMFFAKRTLRPGYFCPRGWKDEAVVPLRARTLTAKGVIFTNGFYLGQKEGPLYPITLKKGR